MVEYCPVDRNGRMLPAELEKLMDEEYFLICCMLANNETGSLKTLRLSRKSPGSLARSC